MTRQKSTYLLLLLLGFSFLSIPQVFSQDGSVGKWWNPEKDGIVTIYKKGDKYYGKISWAKNPRKDTKNPDTSLRSRDVVGSDIFTNFSWDAGEKEWIDGEVYDPKNGKSYSCYMWLEKNNPNKLHVRGYVMGMTFLGRTEIFTKVEE
ncbi:MAG: DUF2147 domain-containing protein [Bacteroidota bacterium]